MTLWDCVLRSDGEITPPPIGTINSLPSSDMSGLSEDEIILQSIEKKTAG